MGRSGRLCSVHHSSASSFMPAFIQSEPLRFPLSRRAGASRVSGLPKATNPITYLDVFFCRVCLCGSVRIFPLVFVYFCSGIGHCLKIVGAGGVFEVNGGVCVHACVCVWVAGIL